MKVTIFTPTYNRAHTLEKLYRSLIEQESQDFEWLLVDDGSTDNTQELIEGFVNENQLNIRYLKQENSGKHVAINRGVQSAKGRYFGIVDSDDWLLPGAVAKIIQGFSTIAGSSEFAGISYNIVAPNGDLIGHTFEGAYVDAKSNEREKYNILGDKFEVFYTEILKKFPFPTFPGENFLTETIVWTRIAHSGYKIRWFNESTYVADYQENGLTENQNRLNASNPLGYALRIKEQVEYGNISLKQKMGYYSNYYYLLKDRKSLREMGQDLNVSGLIIALSATVRRLLNKHPRI